MVASTPATQFSQLANLTDRMENDQPLDEQML